MSLPDNEFKSRLERVKELAAKNGLDFIFYLTLMNIMIMNGRYLTGRCYGGKRGSIGIELL